jgi:hypothetical protein
VEALASRPVEWQLGVVFDSVNRLFAILFQFFCKTPETQAFVAFLG